MIIDQDRQARLQSLAAEKIVALHEELRAEQEYRTTETVHSHATLTAHLARKVFIPPPPPKGRSV